MKSQSLFLPAARTLASIPALALVAALTGCAGFSTTATPSPTAGSAFSGKVHGGQQPVFGAFVYLIGASSTGYGALSSSLLTAGSGIQQNQYGNFYATTDASGGFGFKNYTCPTPTTQVYLLATGGNPGLGAGVNNQAITLIAAVGNCSSITTNSFFSLNEVTTAAFVMATQQFTTGVNNVGAPAGNATGLATAFALAQDLASTSGGTARATNIAGTGSVPQAKLNTLGNIVAPCINSSSSGSSSCTSLFNAVTPAGGTRPGDTVGALLLIAQNPGNNVANINALASASSPFQPSANVTTDFTLGITYSGGGMTAPGNVVIDAAGNAFIGNSPSTAVPTVSGTDSIVGFGPNGAVLTGTNGYTAGIHAPTGLAIDSAGNIWSTDATNGTLPDQVVKLTSAGALIFAFNDSTISGPQGIAIDSTNNAWVGNFNINSLSKITSGGARTQPAVTSPNFNNPIGVGIDGAGNIFAAGTGSSTILKFTSAGVVTSPAGGYTAGSLNQPTGISIDAAGNVWTIDNGSSAITKITNTGTFIPQTAGGSSLSNAFVLSIDGAGGAWYANCRSCSPNATSPDNLEHTGANQAQATGTADGFQDSHLARVGTTAINASGNVWITSNANGTVTEFIGVSSPVITPLAVAASSNKLGTRP